MPGQDFILGQVLLKTDTNEPARLVQVIGTDGQEEIVLRKTGKYWNQYKKSNRPDGVVIVTNHRLVFQAKLKTLFTQTDFLSFPFEYIKNLEVTKVMFVTPAIKFEAQGKSYVFTFLSNAEEVFDAIKHVRP